MILLILKVQKKQLRDDSIFFVESMKNQYFTNEIYLMIYWQDTRIIFYETKLFLTFFLCTKETPTMPLCQIILRWVLITWWKTLRIFYDTRQPREKYADCQSREYDTGSLKFVVIYGILRIYFLLWDTMRR